MAGGIVTPGVTDEWPGSCSDSRLRRGELHEGQSNLMKRLHRIALRESHTQDGRYYANLGSEGLMRKNAL